MTKLATPQTESAPFKANLGRSLNGLHKAFVSNGTPEIEPHVYMVGMTKLATPQTGSASLNAHLGRSLNGLHKAFVSIGALDIEIFLFPTPPLMRALGGILNKKPPIFRLRTSAYSALSG